METLFRCPSCGGALHKTERGLACERNHSFDRARQGYVHLLMSNKMHSKEPGDTKEMVSARRDFLRAGYYDIFVEKLSKLSKEYLRDISVPVILDAGCGEGYYTAKVKEALPRAAISGFDISKSAVRAAAGSYKSMEFAVASIFDIPVHDNSCDLLVNVFAPIVEQEFCRVLKKGGIMIIAVPGARHLYEMKEILYDEPYENEVKETAYEGFTQLNRVSVRGRIDLDTPEMVWNLFSMTPYYWKTGIEGSARLRTTEQLSTEIHFDFLIYRKD